MKLTTARFAVEMVFLMSPRPRPLHELCGDLGVTQTRPASSVLFRLEEAGVRMGTGRCPYVRARVRTPHENMLYAWFDPELWEGAQEWIQKEWDSIYTGKGRFCKLPNFSEVDLGVGDGGNDGGVG